MKTENYNIQKTLLKIGVPPNLYGYPYLTYALELSLIDPSYLRHITKGLYIDVSKKYQTSPPRVERAIRHAITVAWEHGNLELLHNIFENSVNPEKGKPTNSEFICGLYYYLS